MNTDSLPAVSESTPTEKLDALIAFYRDSLSEHVHNAEEAEKLATRFRRESAESAWVLGRALNARKKKTQHGQWLPYLEKMGIPERMGQRYMLIGQIRHVSHLGATVVESIAIARRQIENQAREAAQKARVTEIDSDGNEVDSSMAEILKPAEDENAISRTGKANTDREMIGALKSEIDERNREIEARDERIAIMEADMSHESLQSIDHAIDERNALRSQLGELQRRHEQDQRTIWGLKKRIRELEKTVRELSA